MIEGADFGVLQLTFSRREEGGTIVQFHAVGNTLMKETPNDARGTLRRRVLKAAVAASNDRHLTVACAVRDMSATGARLRIEGSVTVPDTFELIIATEGLEADCQVVWRKLNEVGVRFLAAPRIVAAKRAQVISPVIPTRGPTLRRKKADDLAI
jgi:hypothetical protein